jgi:hypothetical protein
MSEQFFVIDGEEDVVMVKENRPLSLIPESMFKVGELKTKLICQLIGIQPNDWDANDKYPERKKYVKEGLVAELLKLGDTKWKKGKVRIKVSIEFASDEPDEPKSPLDDFRKQN